MRVVVARILSGKPGVEGYLRRYMFELEKGILIGSVTASLERDLLETLEKSDATGYMIV